MGKSWWQDELEMAGHITLSQEQGETTAHMLLFACAQPREWCPPQGAGSSPTGATGKPIADNPSLGLSFEVILRCFKLTIKTNHHTRWPREDLISTGPGFLVCTWDLDNIILKVFAASRFYCVWQFWEVTGGVMPVTSAIILLVSPKKSKFKASSSVVAWWRDRFFRWMFWSGSSNVVTFLGGKESERTRCCREELEMLQQSHFSQPSSMNKTQATPDTSELAFKTDPPPNSAFK